MWEETSEERHLEGFREGLPQLMRKHHSATVCKTSTKIAISLSVFEAKYHRVLYLVENGYELPPKMHTKYCASACKTIPKHDESEALEGSIFIKWRHSAPK